MFPTGYSGLSKIRVGQWRNDAQGAMQVVSGAMNRQKVHYEAPPANQLHSEMTSFMRWFNAEEEVRSCDQSGTGSFVVCHDPSF